ncbi:MAG: hypothetical protein MUE31_08070 [Candidatus Nanopelagicales bacterium]|jgi:hypothetical protein|nr:hypothetical protein [Candidatus Nanopelagicales bacterium]
MSDAQATVAIFLLAPMVVLGVVGMVRGYHMTLRVWKGDHKGDKHGDD